MYMMWVNLFLMLSLTALSMCAKDYYQVLGIDRSATDRQIKKAFRKLAVQYHPDKNKEPGAEDKFREIAEAYEVLSDSDKKREYDNMGHTAYTSKSSGRGGGGQHAFHFNFDDFFRDFNFEDPFEGDFFEPHGFKAFDSFGDDFMDMEDFFGRSGGFGHDAFGSHDSFFGGDHFQHHMHHREAHNRAHNKAHFGGHGHHYEEHHAQKRNQGNTKTCRTVTQRVGNMVTTYTTCM